MHFESEIRKPAKTITFKLLALFYSKHYFFPGLPQSYIKGVKSQKSHQGAGVTYALHYCSAESRDSRSGSENQACASWTVFQQIAGVYKQLRQHLVSRDSAAVNQTRQTAGHHVSHPKTIENNGKGGTWDSAQMSRL